LWVRRLLLVGADRYRCLMFGLFLDDWAWTQGRSICPRWIQTRLRSQRSRLFVTRLGCLGIALVFYLIYLCVEIKLRFHGRDEYMR